ncbi:MFS domain-containing protein [Mycena indigotica]|uniref:MFS domain-containing protein n=1 Tax=Mycena indigotica TaxID=2126181 RepID=A0A8H6SLA0_9AGAR|nr:MFS domain-containing protein [Mycena indigotica]KAF7301835.1 MFS domain-containing protein [Mycena indigotica]
MDKSSLPDSESVRALEEKTSSFQSDLRPVYNSEVDTSGVDEKKLIRKIDFALIPWFSLLFMLSFLDRTSIGNAKLYHMEADLNITDSQYLIALTVFFIAYATFEIPSNIILKRFRPAVWFSTIMIGWGLIMTLQGVAHNFGGITTLRWMLGTFEAGLYPGIVYHSSSWYKRSELGLRAAIFTSATGAGAFGGLLAAAISNMGGIAGRPAWAWIFILEGLVTIVVGILSFWFVQDFPDTAKFLTEEERTFVIRRLQDDGLFSAGGERIRWKSIVASLKEKKTWINMVQVMGCNMPLYAFSLFTPSIVSQVCHTWFVQCSLGVESNLLNLLGFKATKANLMSVPIYVSAAIMTVIVAVWVDRYGNRGMWNIALLLLSAIGYVILLVSKNAPLSYFAVYVASWGIFPAVPNTVTWIANNNEGSVKRGVTLAAAIGMGNLHGAVSSNVYRARDQPRYHLGHGLVLMYICMGIIANSLFLYLIRKENARRDRGERDEVIGPETLADNGNGRFETVEDAKREKGDNWSGYRYVL